MSANAILILTRMRDLLSLLRRRLRLISLLHTSFRIDHRVTTTGSEHAVWVLLQEVCEVLFSVPYPRRVGFEEQVDFLYCVSGFATSVFR